MELKNLIRSALTVRGKSGRFNRAASHRGIRFAPLLLVAVMLAAVAVLAETSNPARTAQAQNYGNVVCQSPPAESCPTYDDDVSAEGFEIWSATLTVAQQAAGSTTFGYGAGFGTLDDTTFTYSGTQYTIHVLSVTASAILNISLSSGLGTDTNKLILHVGTQQFPFADAIYSSALQGYSWVDPIPSWSVGDSVAVKITGPSPPNAYGYRTIWTALMTAKVSPMDSAFVGYDHVAGTSIGEITNDTIVTGRDETVTIGNGDQPQYPWTGYKIELLADSTNRLQITFDENSYPTDDEVAGWTLTLGGGVELPFTDAPAIHALTPWTRQFTYDPNWTDGQQVVVSIRTDELQNRLDRVTFKASDLSSGGKVHRVSRSFPAGSSYVVLGSTGLQDDPRGADFRVPGHTFSLETFEVLRDGTDDEDPVWITATFRAPNDSISWPAYWEGEFEQFHTLFLHWYDTTNSRAATYTLPLRSAATEGGIQRKGSYVSFVWVRTYKEFQRKGLDLARHGHIYADMLAPPRPATARAVGEGGEGFSLSGYYEPVTVTSVDFTSNPGSDQVYGPWSTIQVTVTFSEDVTVGYVGSKRDAAELDLEMDGQTRTAHYARTEGNRVKFEYTVLAGDEETFALRLRPNSLRLSRDKPSEHGSIRDSSGRDAVLDHNGLASTAHRVDAVSPEFASAQVSTDGAQVAVTFDESIKSPAILRWFGVQTSLLQSLTLDVWVDGDLAARSGAALSGDTVTLTMAEPITQGQTVTVSYDNLFIETGESIFDDLHGNKLATFTGRPVTNGSTLADVDRPDGGLALSRTDLEIDEGESGTYTVALASQPASDVTVEISQRPPGRATVSPASLTFTADNWNTPQTVTITSEEDANYLDRWLLLRHVATGDNYGASAVAWLLLRDGYNLVTATPNTGATGSPTIDGTPQVDHTLTVDLSNIADADGLTHASYTYLYQWIRNNAEIAGQTDSAYTLVSADEGQTIKVKVSFTDDANNAESRTSAATVAVAPRPNSRPTGAPTINGTPQVLRTLTVDTSEIADADGLETAVFRYQWFGANDFATVEFHGEVSETYTLGPLSEGLAIKVKVSFTDDRGHSETLTSAATETVIAADPNSEPTGLPAINGTPQDGETLTADTSAIDDADGLTNVAYRYQWIAGGSDIDGATGASYTLTASEQGQTVRVRVTFTDDADNEETLTSEATAEVTAAPAPLTGAFHDLPDSHDGSTAFTFRVLFSEDVGISYVNMRDDAFSLSEGDVTGARRVDGRNDLWEITVEPDDNSDVGITLPANRSCTTTGAICTREDSPRQLTNSPTATVTGPAEAPPTNTSAAGAPTISGTPQVEQTLTADTSSITDEDGLTNVSYSYQWIAGGSDIDGATGSTYTLTSSEQGQTVQVRVTFTDDADNEETLTSEATAEVTAAPAPLTASRPDSRFQSARHNGADDRPQMIVAFSLPVASFEKTTPSVSLTGAAVSSVRRHQEDGLDNAWIFFLDPDGDGDIVLSLVTGRPCDSGGICTEGGTTLSRGVQVTLPGPEEEAGDDQQTPQSPPAKPTNLTATVNADGHIVLSWAAPNDDSITGYQILRRRPSEGESALLVYVADTESTATTFTDTGVTAGVTHVYRVKAINAAGLSGWSNYVNPTP